MAMSGSFRLSSDCVHGYTLSDRKCFSNSSGLRRTLAMLPCSFHLDQRLCIEKGRLKLASNSSSFVCRASSVGYRKNPDFNRFRNRQSDERGEFNAENSEMYSSRTGPLFSLSNSSKFQATSSPGPREKEIVELFRKVQAQLRAKAATKREDKKNEEASKGHGKDSETVDSLLKLLRKHSGEQSKKAANFSSNGDNSYPQQEPAVGRQDRSGNFVSPQNRDHNASSSFTRPTSSFRRNSPVPRSETPPTYSSEATFDQSSSYSVTWTHKKNVVESPEAETEPEIEPEYESEPGLVEAILEPGSELKTESSLYHQEKDEHDVTLDVLSDDNDDDDDDDDESLDDTEEETDEAEEEAVKDRDLSTLKLMELRDIAKSRGLKGFSKLKKAELVKLLASDSN
ncbi:unnamed protein product [Cochlearia groenlandica]